jgi:hypothetical protein
MEDLNRRLDQHGVKASEDEVFKRSEAILSVADDRSHFYHKDGNISNIESPRPEDRRFRRGDSVEDSP